MGVPAELTRVRPARRVRRGAALPTALFGLVVLSVLGAGIFSVGSVQRQATFNRESTARALLVAEEGLAHGVAVVRDSLRNRGYTRLLRGSDDATGTADDGRLIGYTLGSGIAVPVAGRSTTDGTYTIQLLDDPADPISSPLVDGNHKLIMRCIGTTTSGASAQVDVVFGATPMPAMVVDGSLNLQGTPDLLGACGGAHANANLSIVSGTVTSSGTLSATGSAGGMGGAVNTSGTPMAPVGRQQSIEVPSMSAAEFCPFADYDLRADGTILHRASGATWPAIAAAVFGWRRTSASPVTWSGSGAITSGTWCVAGNAAVSGNSGTNAFPLSLTVVATGSIQVSGNPFLVPSYEDVLFVADGDIWVSGNSHPSNENFEGVLYAGAQCRVGGTARIAGQLMCKNNAQPANALDHAAGTSLVEGSPEIVYSCGTSLTRRKILEWIQVSN